jgi:hypothetical protein
MRSLFSRIWYNRLCAVTAAQSDYREPMTGGRRSSPPSAPFACVGFPRSLSCPHRGGAAAVDGVGCLRLPRSGWPFPGAPVARLAELGSGFQES